MILKEITFKSQEFEQMVQLREDILRKPLGLKFEEGELDHEGAHYHLGLFEDGILKACLVLQPINEDEIKMRQVAVASQTQSKGYGSQLVAFSEVFAKEKNYKKIVLNARLVAVNFYLKLKYNKLGDEFMEVGIPHYKMEKELT